jgi:hypothetical protein
MSRHAGDASIMGKVSLTTVGLAAAVSTSPDVPSSSEDVDNSTAMLYVAFGDVLAGEVAGTSKGGIVVCTGIAD